MSRRGSTGVAFVSFVLVFGLGFPWVYSRHSENREGLSSPDRSSPTQSSLGARAVIGSSLPSTEDVQAFDLLWRDLERLHRTAADLGSRNFKLEAVRKTSDYLEYEAPEREDFLERIDSALEVLREERARLEGPAEGEAAILRRREQWDRWGVRQKEISDCLLELRPSSRLQLLAERRLLWLLRLDSGIRSAEFAQAKRDRRSGSSRVAGR